MRFCTDSLWICPILLLVSEMPRARRIAVHRTGHILPLSTLGVIVLMLPSLCGVGRLEHIATLLKQPVDALLVKHRDSFLKPLLARRLRALPTLTQVGYVEAVSYCLKKQVPREVVRGT